MHVRRSAEIALLVLACGAVQANAQGPTEVDPAAQDTSAVVVVEILDDRSLKIAAYSFAFYSPETELAFGAGGIATFYSSGHDPDLRPSKVSLSGYYSTRKQFKISQATQLFLDRNRWYATGAAPG